MMNEEVYSIYTRGHDVFTVKDGDKYFIRLDNGEEYDITDKDINFILDKNARVKGITVVPKGKGEYYADYMNQQDIQRWANGNFDDIVYINK